MVAHATPARRVDENVVRGDGPKVLTQTGGCGSEDELTPRPAGHKFAQCNNPTSLFALDHAVASPLPAAMVSRSLAKHPPRVLDPHFVGWSLIAARARQTEQLAGISDRTVRE
jgi:hypothetical protein